VGLWTSKTEENKSLERLPREGPLSLVTSLGAAIAEIHQLIQPLLVERGAAEAKVEAKAQAAALAAV
jgi:hypothetical protein